MSDESLSVPLREHLTKLIEAESLRNDERHHAGQDAIKAALSQQEKRFESVTEWRTLVEGLVRDKASRVEVEQRIGALADKLDALDKRLDKQEGSGAGRSAVWGVLVTIGTLVLVAFGLWMKR